MSKLSDNCIHGDHDACDGCNLDNQAGCMCNCHFDRDFDEDLPGNPDNYGHDKED